MKQLCLLLFAAVSAKPCAREKLIEVYAKRFAYKPEIIRIKRGDVVKIKLISEDVTHGLFVDGYEVETIARPGESCPVSFVAKRTGRFTFRCSVTCGEFHPYMVGYLIVGPNNRFMFFLSALLPYRTHKRGSHPEEERLKTAEEKLFGLIDTNWRFELTRYGFIRALLKSRWFPLLFIIFNLAVFTVVLISAFEGGYSAGNYNFGIMIVWILWWVLLMLVLVPGFSRAWCLMCPFPIFSDWFQRRRLFGVTRGKLAGLNLKWPKALRNMWVMNIGFLVTTFFSGFFTVKPYATFVLLFFIIVLAFVIGLLFEKRSFCLYICPVSGFQGLY